MKQIAQPPAGACGKANDVIALIGDKWTVHIVMLLEDGTRRFTEIQRSVEGVSRKMLTTTLRGLERDGYVTRTVFPTVPPRVDYTLTELGRELAVPLRALGSWAISRYDQVIAARATYDTRPAD